MMTLKELPQKSFLMAVTYSEAGNIKQHTTHHLLNSSKRIVEHAVFALQIATLPAANSKFEILKFEKKEREKYLAS